MLIISGSEIDGVRCFNINALSIKCSDLVSGELLLYLSTSSSSLDFTALKHSFEVFLKILPIGNILSDQLPPLVHVFSKARINNVR